MPEQHLFENFDPQDLEVTPLPAAEVRRLGDRRRRRRAAVATMTAAAAVAVIAVGATSLSGPGPGTAPPVTPPSPSPDVVTWQTDIPSDFPIDRGLRSPEGDPIAGPGPRAGGITPLDVCAGDGASGPSLWPDDHVDRIAASATGPEFLDARELITLPDADAAAAVLTTIEQEVTRCSGDGDAVWTVHDVPGVGDQSLTVSRTFEPWLGGDVYQLTRVGAAVLAVDRGGEYDLTSTVPHGIEDVSATSAALVGAMCVFSADGCDDQVTRPDSVPADFPIGAGLADPRVFPSRAVLAEELEFCGERPLAGIERVDGRTAELSGGESSETRSVALYPDEAIAADAEAALVASAARCPRVPDLPDSAIQLLDAAPDWPGRTVVTRFATEPPTAMLLHVVRVGPALLLSQSYADPGQAAISGTRELLEPQRAALEELIR